MMFLCVMAAGAVIAVAEEDEYELDYYDWLESVLTHGYMGVTSDGGTIYCAMGDDYCVLVFLDADTARSASFVGPYTDHGDGAMTVTDMYNELALTFGVTNVEGGHLIDLGDLGSAVVAEVSVVDVLQGLQVIEDQATPVA